jgi:hypothetical protein
VQRKRAANQGDRGSTPTRESVIATSWSLSWPLGYRRTETQHCKDELAVLLSTAIRTYRRRDLNLAERDKWEGREVARRIEAAFALYNIPDDWPEPMQWEWLARVLLGKHFPGCRVLSKAQGGPRKIELARLGELKSALAEEFERYKAANPKLRKAATSFLDGHSKECKEAGFSDAKSFAQAMRQLSRH